MEKEDFVDPNFFPNSYEITRNIVNSLIDSDKEGMLFERFQTNIDRNFLFDFLLYSLEKPQLSKAATSILTKLFSSLPSEHKLDYETYNLYFKKTCASIPILFCSKENKFNMSAGLQFFNKIISNKKDEFIEFISQKNWTVFLNSIINSFSGDVRDIFDQLEEVFLNGLLLGALKEGKRTPLIINFLSIFSTNANQVSHFQILFKVLLNKFLQFPGEDATERELIGYKYACDMIFTIKDRCKDKQFSPYSEQILSTCFQVLLAIIKDQDQSKSLTLNPLPIDTILKLFSDCIFTQHNSGVVDHLTLLTRSEIRPSSPWIPVFIHYLSMNISQNFNNFDDLCALVSFTASKPLILDYLLSPLFVISHESALKIHNVGRNVALWTTALCNIYQRSLVKKDKQMQNYISSLIYNFSLPEWEMTEDQYKLTDLFNLLISNNIELLHQKICRRSLFAMTPYGSVLLPSYTLIFLSLLPFFFYSNLQYTLHDKPMEMIDEEIEVETNFMSHELCNTISTLIDGIDSLKSKNRYLSALAIAAISLSNITKCFSKDRTIITKLLRIAERYNSKLLELATKYAETPVIFSNEAQEIEKLGKKYNYMMNNNLVTFIETEDGPIHILIRSETGINHLTVLENQKPPQSSMTGSFSSPSLNSLLSKTTKTSVVERQSPKTTSNRIVNLTLDQIYENIPDLFNRFEKKQRRQSKSKITTLFLSLGIYDLPKTIEFDTTEFDDLCNPLTYNINITSINLESASFFFNKAAERFTIFYNDLKKATSMPIGKVEYTHYEENSNDSSPILIVFNETQRQISNITDNLPHLLVLVVSMNESNNNENEPNTYVISPAKIPGEGFLFPFTKLLEHSFVASEMPYVILSFIFYFFSCHGDNNSPDILKDFLSNCEKRRQILDTLIP